MQLGSCSCSARLAPPSPPPLLSLSSLPVAHTLRSFINECGPTAVLVFYHIGQAILMPPPPSPSPLSARYRGHAPGAGHSAAHAATLGEQSEHARHALALALADLGGEGGDLTPPAESGASGGPKPKPDAAAGGGTAAPEPPLVLIGHSIGAHIALELMASSQRPGPAHVAHALGIHPFLTLNRSSPFQTAALFIARWSLLRLALLSLASAVSLLISLLPAALQRLVLRPLLARMDGAAAETARSFITTPRCVRAFLAMGLSEMTALAPPPDWPKLRALQEGGRASFIYASVADGWAPEHHRAELLTQVPALILGKLLCGIWYPPPCIISTSVG